MGFVHYSVHLTNTILFVLQLYTSFLTLTQSGPKLFVPTSLFRPPLHVVVVVAIVVVVIVVVAEQLVVVVVVLIG